MKIFENFLVLFLVGFFFLGIGSALAEENGWILTQYSKVLGNQYVYLSTSGAKCINPQDGVGWVAMSPNWNITFFNDKTKLYYPCSYNTWKETMDKYKLTSSYIKWVKVSSGCIAKIKASEYKANNAVVKSQVQEPGSVMLSSLTCWFADDIKVPDKLAQLINSVCGLSASDSIPLEVSYHDKDNKLVTLLDTYRQQQCKIPERTFYLPSNYKLANNLSKVLLNEKANALFDAVYESNKRAAVSKVLSKDANISGGKLSLDKMPEQMTWKGKTITKEQIKMEMEKFINQSK